MKRLIINADDFGMTRTINASATAAHDCGVVTSTTLLVFGEAAEEAIRFARVRPALGLGLHLDLDGFFRFEATGHLGITVDDLDYDEYAYHCANSASDIRLSIRRQFQRFIDFGLRPTHLDGHHNVHLYPGVLPLVVEEMLAFGCNRIRFYREFFADREESFDDCRRLLDSAGIRYPDHFLDLDDELPIGKILERVRPGITEIMVHTDLIWNEENDWRVEQFDFLTSAVAVAALARHDFHLCTYSDLYTA